MNVYYPYTRIGKAILSLFFLIVFNNILRTLDLQFFILDHIHDVLI